MEDVLGIQILEKLENLEQEMNKRFAQQQDYIDEQLEKQQIEFDEKLNQYQKNLTDKMFLFEQEYGNKIDAIFDAVILEKDKNIEKSEKIRKLDKRVESNEAKIFGHERRISVLELKNLKS